MLKIIKTRLKGAKGAWLEELPNVLCAYRTTTRIPTKETPFRLTFGTEAVILVEVGLTSLRVKEEALKRMAKHKEVMARYYNRKVKVRKFNTGDLVLRKVSQATKDPSQGKLGLVT